MKTPSLLKWVFLILLGTNLIACIDHDLPKPDRLRAKSLVRILPEAPQVKHISMLRYDNQGRLGSIYTYQTPDSANAQTETSTYQYDSQGRLSEMVRILSNGGSERYVYGYDGTGRLATIRYTGAENNIYNFLQAYDGDGKLVSTRRLFSGSGFSFEKERILFG